MILGILLIPFLAAAQIIILKVFRKRSDEETERRAFKPWIKKTISLIMAVSGFACGLFLLTTAFVDLQLNTSFEQRLTVLNPAISEQEEEGLRATWASMRDRQDYLDLKGQMDRMAALNEIELPEPLLD